MILLVALLGAGVGLGALIAANALRPRVVPLTELLATLDAPSPSSSTVVTARGRVSRRLLSAAGVEIDELAPDFVLAERSAEAHATAKLVGAVLGAVSALLLLSASWLVGIGISIPIGVVLAVAAASAGFVFPDMALREEANRRRQAFRHALSAYLDLVNVILAGGGGIDSALHAAADAGDGPAFAQLRHALARARLTNRSPWDVFSELGARLEVEELSELAASVSLAGTHGARIRQSLAAKADALRGHQLAEIEADAEAATERMTIPVAVLLFGFLVFIAYPALVQITSITTTAR